MSLVEQTRFGNLVESACGSPEPRIYPAPLVFALHWIAIVRKCSMVFALWCFVAVGTAELSLLELACGSVQQEITFVERDGRTTIDSYRLNFHIHFQVIACFVSVTPPLLTASTCETRKSSRSLCA